MARIAVGGLHHETNSFAPQAATYARFVEADGWPGLLRGQALIDGTAGINLAITGFIAATRDRHELRPLVWANACPSGPVTGDAFERLAGSLERELAAALPLDALFLDLHGAMITEDTDDGEGVLLARLRTVAPDVPIVAALDLHANVSDSMVERADALVAYRTYPHVDLAETGVRAAALLEGILSGETFAAAHRKLDFLIPLPWQTTALDPARGLYAFLARIEAETGATLSFCPGFPPGDTRAGGPSVLAYAPDRRSADAAADWLASAVAAAEGAFAGRLWTPEAAIARARAVGRTVVLADTQDNPGGGGTSDTTGLLDALIAARLEDAALALMVDEDAARAAHVAGPGGVLAGLPLGGRYGPEDVAPCVQDWEVVRLGDGRFTATGPMYRGSRMELGPMALLRPRAAPGVDVLVASRRVQAADRAIFGHLGVDPAAKAVLALKSSVHFRADFDPLAAETLVVVAAGWNVADPAALPFRRLPDPIRRSPSRAPGA